MTEQEYALIQRLSRCTFYPGSFDKRFIKTLMAYDTDQPLSERQHNLLLHLEKKYQEQLAGKARQ